MKHVESETGRRVFAFHKGGMVGVDVDAGHGTPKVGASLTPEQALEHAEGVIAAAREALAQRAT